MRILLCLDRENPVVFNPKRPIDQDKELDIATFDMEPVLAASQGRKFYPLHQSPAPRIQKNDLLAFVGYPGRFRIASDEIIEFGRILYGVFAADVSGLSVVANMSNAIERFNKQPELQAPPKPHGGISGSPCFLVRAGQPPRLMGFTKEYSDSLKLLLFTSARCLNADGSINRQIN